MNLGSPHFLAKASKRCILAFFLIAPSSVKSFIPFSSFKGAAIGGKLSNRIVYYYFHQSSQQNFQLKKYRVQDSLVENNFSKTKREDSLPPKKSSILIGAPVDIIQKCDQSTGTLTRGVVSRHLTRKDYHPRGIKVILESGEVGRVQCLVNNSNFPSTSENAYTRPGKTKIRDKHLRRGRSTPSSMVPRRSQLFKGCEVSIIAKEDQKIGKLTHGIVNRILTNKRSHPRGIKVQLDNGMIGRVQHILSGNEKNIDQDQPSQKVSHVQNGLATTEIDNTFQL